MIATRIFIFLLFFHSSVTMASMYFEPVVGYGLGTAKTTVQSTTTSSSNETAYISPSIGFKFGYHVDYVYVILDARYSIINIADASIGASPSMTNLGVAVGWDWNLPIRTFIGFDIKADSLILGERTTGTGQRLGIGYYLNLNTLMSLEFVTFKTTGSAGSVDLEMTSSYSLLTFSFPLDFTYPETSWKDKVRQ